MDYLEEIKVFFEENAGIKRSKIGLNSTMEKDLGITGDDADEIMANFFKKFNIDRSNFNSSLYFGEEGIDLLNLTRIINFFFNRKKMNTINKIYDIKIKDLIDVIVLKKWNSPELN